MPWRHLLVMLITSLLMARTLSAAEIIPLWDHEIHTGTLAEWVISGTGHTPRAHSTPLGLELMIQAPDGSHVTREAFTYRPYVITDSHDSDKEFRAAGTTSIHIRHVFRTSGLHTLTLTGADGSTLQQWQVAVEPKEHLGPIGLSLHNPHLLAHADGTPIIPIGSNIAWALRPDRLHQFIRYLDALAANGGNHCRVWCASWFAQVQGDQPETIRLEQAWLLDQILTAAKSRNIFVTLVLDNHHDLLSGAQAPYGSTPAERVETFLDPNLAPGYANRLRYLIARHGAFDSILAWELFNEIDLILTEQPFSDQFSNPEHLASTWANAAAGLLHDIDPDRRLVTISLTREHWPKVFSAPNIDMVSLHRYIPTPDERGPEHSDGVGVVLDALASARQHGKPILMSEVGHHSEGTGENQSIPGHEEDPNGALLRHQAWAGLMGGGCGSAMNWWWDRYLEPNQLWHIYQPLAITTALIDWTDRELQPLDANRDSSLRVLGWRSPNQALIWPQVRADNWQALGPSNARPTYFRTPPRLQIPGLTPNRRYAITAVDMLSGETENRDLATANAEGQLELRLSYAAGREVLVIVWQPETADAQSDE